MEQIQEVDPRLEQATVARFYSYVFQVAVIEARELCGEDPAEAGADRVLVDAAIIRQTPDEGVRWSRAFVQGLIEALDFMRGWSMSNTDRQKVVGVYCDHDPAHMERVAVGLAIHQALGRIQQSLYKNFPDLDAAGMMADWFATEGQTTAGMAWLMDTTAHLLVADEMA